MRITPLEIKKKDFQKAFRGYEKEEVDAFLLSLSSEWERVMEENRDSKRKLEISERELNRLKEVESSLFKTLKSAEDTGANVIDHATRTAELHIREAQINAEGMLSEAKSKSRAMVEEAEEKSRDIIDEMLEETKNLKKEYNYLLDLRDNLIQDMKNLSNETIEKINRVASKHKKIDEKIKDLKSIGVEKKVVVKEEREEKEKEHENPVQQTKPSVEPKQEGGSFFDSI